MGQTIYVADPDNRSAVSVGRYYDSTVSWSAPAPSYGTMTKLYIAFTTSAPGHYVYVNYTDEGGTVHGVTTINNTNGSTYPAGNYTYEIPTSYWGSRDSGTCTLRFKRPSGNPVNYTNIRFIVEYSAIVDKSVVVVQDATAGDPQTVLLSNPIVTAYHWVNWGYGSNLSSPTVTSGSIQYGAATRSPAWAVPSADLTALYREFPNSAYIDGRVLVDTLTEEGLSVGDQAVSCRLLIPQNSDTLPTMTLTLDKTQDSVATASGADYLQGHTTLKVRPAVSPKCLATTKTVVITTPDGDFDGADGRDTAILVNTSGTYQISVTATDSRGFTVTETTSISVTPCEAPVFTGVSAERCQQDGTPDDEGRYISIAATASIPIQSWTYSITQSGKATVIESGSLTNGSGIIGGGQLNPDIVYIVSITATDPITQTVSTSTSVGTTLYTIHRMAGGKGVAFGQVSHNYGVEITESWPFYTHGQEIQELMLDFAHPVGSVIHTLDEGFNPNAKWPWSHWNRLENVFLLASGSAHPIYESGGAESDTVDLEIRLKEQPFHLTADNLPENSLLYSYSGKRASTNKLANTGTALKYLSDSPDPLFTMRLGTPQFIVRYADYASTAYAVGDYTYRVSGEARVYYRCISPVASGAAWNADNWEEVQYSDIRDDVAVQIMWENQERIPAGGFAVGDYGFRIVNGANVLYRCVRSAAAYASWSGDAEHCFVEVPYSDAVSSATVSTMPPYLTVNIWVRAK